MTSLDKRIPRNMTLTGAKTLDKEGLVLKKGSGNTLEIITAKGDTAIAVLDQAIVDVTQTSRATRTGEKAGVFILGCGAVVNVASVTGITYTTGAAVYLDDSVDGMVTTTAATSRPIGHYVGDGETTTASGDVIPVVLDVQIGASTV